MHSQMFIKY
nr:unnamed protein product [Callosobruchus analis]CAI5826816.1 unnamed protein product [Callosobruchus analis]CAI5832392.1 unnamed protein product [Callosobruchus analis]CAI5839246.1 unnamed protein product [Callosobruchus analis]CAI5846559.1 unnamed protein product [Callosobruchus analis]